MQGPRAITWLDAARDELPYPAFADNRRHGSNRNSAEINNFCVFPRIRISLKKMVQEAEASRFGPSAAFVN